LRSPAANSLGARRKLAFDCFDDALKVNAARAFHEDLVAGAQIPDKPPARGFRVRKKQ